MKCTISVIVFLLLCICLSGCRTSNQSLATPTYMRTRIDLPIRVQVDYVHEIGEGQALRASLISL